MVDEVLTNTIGLIFGFGVSQALGDYAESKIKPGIVATSTNQDKTIAEVSNDGPKLALAYGAYTKGKTSPFMKSFTVGSVMSTIFDVYWRYKHDGVPYSGYKLVPIEIPIGTPTGGTPVGDTPIGGITRGRLFLISDTDSLEDIIAQGRILEEI